MVEYNSSLRWSIFRTHFDSRFDKWNVSSVIFFYQILPATMHKIIIKHANPDVIHVDEQKSKEWSRNHRHQRENQRYWLAAVKLFVFSEDTIVITVITKRIRFENSTVSVSSGRPTCDEPYGCAYFITISQNKAMTMNEQWTWTHTIVSLSNYQSRGNLDTMSHRPVTVQGTSRAWVV